MSHRGFAHILILLLIISSILLFVALYYTQVLKKNIPGIGNQAANDELAIQTKEEYANPFDKKSQYVNPFEQNKNPFDNVK